jgi:cytochrome c peroxidase
MADGGITHLEILPLAPFTDPTEHALSLNEVVSRVRGPRYANDFVRAFGDDSVYSARIFRALMDYQLTLQSTQTRWDRVQMGLASWTTSEEFGARVFAKNCANCHQGAQFSSFAYAQHEPIGSNDQGRSRVTQKPEDFGFFKIPSLRNWKWTPPYGHAGQWPTLEDVLSAFERGANSPLTAQERAGLLAFLESINDDAP